MSDCNCGHYDCIDCLKSIVVRVEAEFELNRNSALAVVIAKERTAELEAERDALREAVRMHKDSSGPYDYTEADLELWKILTKEKAL